MVRKLLVELGLKKDQFDKGLDQSGGKVDKFSSMVKTAGVALVGAFAAQKVISGLKNLVVNLGNTADRLLDLEVMTGITTDTLQEYEYVSRIAGVNTEVLANASLGLTRRLAGATSEASPLKLALKEIGVSMLDASGQMRNGGDMMDDIIDKLARVENQTERNVLGAQLFGGAWKDMAPVLAMGADGIEKARREARELGLVMSKESLQAANEFRIAQEKLSAVNEAMGRDIAMLLIPVLTDLSTAMAGVVSQTSRYFKDVLTESNMSRLEKFSRLAGASVLGILSGGRLGKGLAQPVFESSWDAQIEEMTELEKINRKISETTQKVMERMPFLTEAQLANHNDIIPLLKQRDEIIRKIAEEEQAAADAAAAAAKAEIKVVEKVKEEQIRALGEIEQLDKEISEAKLQFVQAYSDAERVAALDRLNDLEKEKGLLEAIAKATITARGLDLDFDTDAQFGVGMFDDVDFTDISESIQEITESAVEAKQSLIDWADIGISAAGALGGAFASMASAGKKSTSDIIKQGLSQAIAMLIPKIIAQVPFPLNIGIAAGAPLMAKGLFSAIPAFADGGMVKSPTLAMFGEYPGARLNPEYALRQDQLQGLTSQNITGEFKIRGQDLVVTLNEAQRRGRVY